MAISEIKKVIVDQGISDDFVIGRDYLGIVGFVISEDSDLYVNYNKNRGLAPCSVN